MDEGTLVRALARKLRETRGILSFERGRSPIVSCRIVSCRAIPCRLVAPGTFCETGASGAEVFARSCGLPLSVTRVRGVP